MSLCVLDPTTPISEKVAILRPSSPLRVLILIDLSANVNSRTLFDPFTVSPPRLVGPDQSPIYEPEAASSSILEDHSILAATWQSHVNLPVAQQSNHSSVNLRFNLSGDSLIVSKLTSDHPKLRLIGTAPFKANRRRADRG